MMGGKDLRVGSKPRQRGNVRNLAVPKQVPESHSKKDLQEMNDKNVC
jgi:hypothetical protein